MFASFQQTEEIYIVFYWVEQVVTVVTRGSSLSQHNVYFLHVGESKLQRTEK